MKHYGYGSNLALTKPHATLSGSGAAGSPTPTISFVFTQSTANTHWTINHNLGFFPAITLTDLGGNGIEGEIINTSVNLTNIYFTIAASGVARCI